MKSSEKRIEKVDQLFKNKLDDHSIAPSENAWARVEAELSKTNKLWLGATRTVVLWRSAAAVVVLMGVMLSLLYWSQSDSQEENVLAKKSPASNETKKEVVQPKSTTRDNNDQIAQKKNEVKPKENVNRLANKEDVAQKEVAQEKLPSESKKRIIEIESELARGYSFKMDKVESNSTTTKEEKIKAEATPQAEVASTRQKPIKLEFTLEALPSEETVATTTGEKSTGIMKVLNLAREMKQGEGLSLRDKKDELLAHNFLTKRERNQ